MIKKIIKNFSIITAPIAILALITYISISHLPDKIYVNESTEVSDICIQNSSILNKINVKKDKLNVDFLGVIPVKSVAVQKVEDIKLYPGGTSVGIKLSTEGVLVVGFSKVDGVNGSEISPAKNAGIQLGDVLLKVNEEAIESSKQLSSILRNNNSSSVNIEFLRDGCKFNKEVELIKEGDEYKLGLWVRDSTAGIGTLTFYHKDSETFGALGHPITDGDTNTTFTIKEGELLSASVLSVRKGEKGTPGELRGLFVNEKNSIGNIQNNTSSGIFGQSYVPLVNSEFNQPMSIGYRNEITEGKATIITTIDDSGPKEYEIEIVKLLQQDKPGPKSMIIKVTDEELLSKTGGIVQGMSGSPIIQNNKIVGAVTHVLINKPDIGYGIYIEWMLEDAGILN
ncbi:SpoIVB peptidase [Clostridium celatum]|uniref:SpoIVB peptidase n=1 Tax=Clostridium celatum DSM 1785 TaxID=545697 RepID=L1QGB4_9CLOT|nr:SpoIVB peptidase [Clostridium celatum]EKY27008.1 SpoIVB peptidase [Clostridium celatum DSM 1785]MCE9654733.1 SpoIVB peptidase [Clostridium celatum]MDU6295828.1 SpoIVB peptidase [Clostridium celatum]